MKQYIAKDIRREDRGWGVTVVFGARDNHPTDARRYYYRTRQTARLADISDDIGTDGRSA